MIRCHWCLLILGVLFAQTATVQAGSDGPYGNEFRGPTMPGSPSPDRGGGGGGGVTVNVLSNGAGGYVRMMPLGPCALQCIDDNGTEHWLCNLSASAMVSPAVIGRCEPTSKAKSRK